jgi:carbon-monoxide dehydrogenase medium subunit
MKPASFDYVAPGSLEEALALKAQYGDDSKFLAGGQSLIPAMNFRLVQAAVLVDVNGLHQLDYIRAEGGELHIGALTRQRSLERHPLVKQSAPLMYEAMPHVAHPQIRNRGTLGGSLAHADPAAELPMLAVALNARIKIQSNQTTRWVTATEFFKGLFMTELTPAEMLTEVVLPALAPRTGTAFVEFARRRGDYAMMGVAAVITLGDDGICQEARLVYLNAGDGPVNAVQAAALFKGQAPSKELAEAAAQLAVDQELSPMGNVHASPDYQKHLAKVLTHRALKTAFGRARGN